jgi:hypothetical protein
VFAAQTASFEGVLSAQMIDWMFSPDCENLILVNGKTGFDQVAAIELIKILSLHYSEKLNP